MLIELLVNAGSFVVGGLLSGLTFMSIPVQAINTLAMITGYGSYVVGADLLLLFAGCVSLWFSVKITAGVVLFIWRLLPFT